MSHNGSSQRQRPGDAPPSFPRPHHSHFGHLQLGANASSDRDNESNTPPNPATPSGRLTRHSQVGARRAERIRNLMERSVIDRQNRVRLDYARSHSNSQVYSDRSEDPDSEGLRGQGPFASMLNLNSRLDDLERSLASINAGPMGLESNGAGEDGSLSALRQSDFTDADRRSKRRKLETDKQKSSLKGFRYGKYGQLEQGQLQMEIVSCDGGMFSNKLLYSADNILKDDKSVYCTKGNRCNIVLRHRGASPFTLQELIIKAPTSMNYSHPVNEGLVFVSMEQDDMLNRTAQYQIQCRSRERPQRRQPEPRQIISVRHNDDGTTMRRIERERSYHIQIGEKEDDDESDVPSSLPPEFVGDLPDFNVTTECGDDEGDLEDTRSHRGNPYRIGSLPFENDLDSDSDAAEDDDPEIHGAEHGLASGMHQLRRMARRLEDQRNSRQSEESLEQALEAHAHATQEAIRAVGGQLMTPHARFYIEHDKSKCTIRFDPPISGRFILLKMWTAHSHDASSNVDIQSVIAKGFAGPRYFPSVQLR